MRKRTDENHREIMLDLRKLGYSVLDLSAVGSGCPDILAGKNGVNYLFEIKNPKKPPSKRKLTKDQVEFHGEWRGQVKIIQKSEEVLNG